MNRDKAATLAAVTAGTLTECAACLTNSRHGSASGPSAAEMFRDVELENRLAEWLTVAECSMKNLKKRFR